MRPRPATPSAVRFIRYRGAPSGAATRGALALRPSAPPPARPPGLRLVRPADGVDAEVRAVADAAVRLVVEILAGTRPAAQLSLVAVQPVCREMARLRSATRRGARIVPPKVLSTRLQRPAPAVAETTAVVVIAGRVHALALRLDHARGRWRCTALETTAPGPQGPPVR
ncbi:Rv3235 family protein [Actinomadura sp. 6K520]|uniref:Rv3235 family protein n=1 Tax=Actinomadura sp. 6K520 TaxID=2530364 RepID=UPI0014052DF6|nr:Rv3235 family protein [Actinomadura sp. 6K520]